MTEYDCFKDLFEIDTHPPYTHTLLAQLKMCEIILKDCSFLQNELLTDKALFASNKNACLIVYAMIYHLHVCLFVCVLYPR